MKDNRLVIFSLIVLTNLVIGTCGTVLAHGQIQVGDYAFPAAEPALADLKAQAVSASSLALIELIVGIIGIVLGVGGLAVGLTRKPYARPE